MIQTLEVWEQLIIIIMKVFLILNFIFEYLLHINLKNICIATFLHWYEFFVCFKKIFFYFYFKSPETDAPLGKERLSTFFWYIFY